jgi:hypothetical protein
MTDENALMEHKNQEFKIEAIIGQIYTISAGPRFRSAPAQAIHGALGKINACDHFNI